ncbi:MAG: putative sulfate exporter family transporter [Alphaproteobacteria bacterium]|nr:putative sulfate exporter family transporter [Alphaproteobacteria bacterium]
MSDTAQFRPAAALKLSLRGVHARLDGARRLAPGILLCAGITLAAFVLQAAQVSLLGQAWLELMVLAILLGVAVRTLWKPGAPWSRGIQFSAKTLLETGVMLLGASVDLRAVAAVGPGLLVGIFAIVAAAIAATYGFGRALGLPQRMAILVACGNSICGNSAIAAVAPVIGAKAEDVISSIAFTAVLGVAMVLGLPLLAVALGLSGSQYGIFAGLTVYAVPQVLAATAPLGPLSVQLGTLVKLVRVLMLGPVVLGLSLAAPALGGEPGTRAPRPALGKLVPWFILGFLTLAGLRSLGMLPSGGLPVMAGVASLLTVLSMAALGLGVDIRTVARAGLPAVATVSLSLAALGAMSLGLIRLLAIA